MFALSARIQIVWIAGRDQDSVMPVKMDIERTKSMEIVLAATTHLNTHARPVTYQSNLESRSALSAMLASILTNTPSDAKIVRS